MRKKLNKRKTKVVKQLSFSVAGFRINKTNYTADQWVKDNDWVGVKSSNVSAIKYDRVRKELYVSFNSGGSGYYTGVPVLTARDMFNASSVGTFLHQKLKGSHPWVPLV